MSNDAQPGGLFGSAGEVGSAAPILIAGAALVAVVAIGVGSLGALLVSKERAITAAEAAALAAAVASYPPAAPAGPPAKVASEHATANGASVVTCVCPLDGSLNSRVVIVVVEVTTIVPLFGEMRVRGGARAEFDPVAWLGH